MVDGARRYFAFWLDTPVATLINLPFILLIPLDRTRESLWFTLSMILTDVVALLRDMFGRSPGKVILYLKIVSDRPGESVPRWKLIARSTTTLINGGADLKNRAP